MIEAREVFFSGETRNDEPSQEAAWLSAVALISIRRH